MAVRRPCGLVALAVFFFLLLGTGVSLAGGRPSDAISDCREAGLRLAAQGRFEQAVSSLKQMCIAMDNPPGLVRELGSLEKAGEAWKVYGRARRVGDLEAARTALNEALALYPEMPLLLLARSDLDLAGKDGEDTQGKSSRLRRRAHARRSSEDPATRDHLRPWRDQGTVETRIGREMDSRRVQDWLDACELTCAGEVRFDSLRPSCEDVREEVACRLWKMVAHSDDFADVWLIFLEFQETACGKKAEARAGSLLYERAEAHNSAEVWRAYAQSYPNLAHVETAYARADQLEYGPYVERNDIPALMEFRARYPQNRYVPDATKRIRDKIYQSTDEEMLQWLLLNYPPEPPIDAAVARLDDIHWAPVANGTDTSALARFLARYPSNGHAGEARRRIEGLLRDQIAVAFTTAAGAPESFSDEEWGTGSTKDRQVNVTLTNNGPQVLSFVICAQQRTRVTSEVRDTEANLQSLSSEMTFERTQVVQDLLPEQSREIVLVFGALELDRVATRPEWIHETRKANAPPKLTFEPLPTDESSLQK